MRLSMLLLSLIILYVSVGQSQVMVEVSGEVFDLTGKPLPNASVSYTDREGGRVYRFFTDLNGKFHGVGVIQGLYEIQIKAPNGEEIYSARKYVYPEQANALSVIRVDLSAVPTSSSLAPLKGPEAAQIEGSSWRNLSAEIGHMTAEQLAEVRAENAAIARYNELAPLARSAIKAQDWPKALSLLQQLTEVAPYQWQLYENQGIILTRLQRYAEAVEALGKGIERLGYDQALIGDRRKSDAAAARMLMQQGEASSARGKLSDALLQFRNATEIDPRPALAHMRLCITEYHIGNYQGAVEACNRGLAADPERAEFYQIAAGIESNQERFDEAIPIYEKGIRVCQREIESRRAATKLPQKHYPVIGGDLAGGQSDVVPADDAEVTYRMGQLLLGEGNAFFQLKQYARAASLFERATTMHRYPALAYFNLCAAKFDGGDLKGAAEACDRAIDSDPLMADAYYVKAAALAGEGARHGQSHPSKATVALERYLELAPEGMYAAEARTLLKELNH